MTLSNNACATPTNEFQLIYFGCITLCLLFAFIHGAIGLVVYSYHISQCSAWYANK
jgi:cell division protein FtsL